MRRGLILAIGLGLLASPSQGGDHFSGVKVGAGVGSGGYEGAQLGKGQDHASRHYVISPTSFFAGTYYVELGHYYFQPPSGPRQVIEPGRFDRAGDLAKRLEYEAGMTCIEMNDHYRDNPGYAKTYKAAFHFYEVSHDLDASAQKSDRAAIAENEQKLGALLDAVREDTSGWCIHPRDQKGPEQQGQGGLLARMELLDSLSRHLSHDVEPPPTTAQTANAGPAERSLLVK